jgi:hypothetical protein
VLTQINPTRSWKILRTVRLVKPSVTPKLLKLYSWAHSVAPAIVARKNASGIALRSTENNYRHIGWNL